MRYPLPKGPRRLIKARFPAFREGVIDANARLASALAARSARGIEWRADGEASLAAAAARGPVLIALWHEGILIAPSALARLPFPLASVHSPQPIGRVGSAMVARFGLTPIEMRRKQAFGGQREAMRWARRGGSLVMAADGPSGPARVAKRAVVDMAIATRAELWIGVFELAGARRLPSWDRTAWPSPGRGIAVYRRGPALPGPGAGEAARGEATAALTEALTALQDAAGRTG
jgi:lysophospholipid acyltransferase (LPLAT)-like uncharacterized protein